jgi:hypothetical protein
MNVVHLHSIIELILLLHYTYPIRITKYDAIAICETILSIRQPICKKRTLQVVFQPSLLSTQKEEVSKVKGWVNKIGESSKNAIEESRNPGPEDFPP